MFSSDLLPWPQAFLRLRMPQVLLLGSLAVSFLTTMLTAPGHVPGTSEWAAELAGRRVQGFTRFSVKHTIDFLSKTRLITGIDHFLSQCRIKYLQLSLPLSLYMYRYTDVCMCVYIYIYIYMCIHVYVYTIVCDILHSGKVWRPRSSLTIMMLLCL